MGGNKYWVSFANNYPQCQSLKNRRGYRRLAISMPTMKLSWRCPQTAKDFQCDNANLRLKTELFINSLLHSEPQTILILKWTLEQLLLNNQTAQESSKLRHNANRISHIKIVVACSRSNMDNWNLSPELQQGWINLSISELQSTVRQELYFITSSFSPTLNNWWATCEEEHLIKVVDLPQLATQIHEMFSTNRLTQRVYFGYYLQTRET